MNSTVEMILRYQIYLFLTGYIPKHTDNVLYPALTLDMSSITLPILFSHVLELLSHAAELTKRVYDD